MLNHIQGKESKDFNFTSCWYKKLSQSKSKSKSKSKLKSQLKRTLTWSDSILIYHRPHNSIQDCYQIEFNFSSLNNFRVKSNVRQWHKNHKRFVNHIPYASPGKIVHRPPLQHHVPQQTPPRAIYPFKTASQTGSFPFFKTKLKPFVHQPTKHYSEVN